MIKLYINAKYTKGRGGSQDGQCREMIKFMKESQLVLDNDKYKGKYLFVCLVEGPYYTDLKIKSMKKCITKYRQFIKVFTTKEYILFRNN
jgi:hypothetical protein